MRVFILVTIWLFNMENHHFFFGKPSINGSFSMAMINNQMVIVNSSEDMKFFDIRRTSVD